MRKSAVLPHTEKKFVAFSMNRDFSREEHYSILKEHRKI